MKRLAAILILLGTAFAQNTPTIGVLPDNGPTLPATCVVGQIYFQTVTSTIGLYQCNPANTWTAFSTGGGGGGTVTHTGNLTLNSIVLGNGTADTKVSTGLTTDGTAGINVGATGVGGTITLFGATSGSNTFTAPGNGTQLSVSATTVLATGASGAFNATNALTLSSVNSKISIQNSGGSTINTAGVDLVPNNSYTQTSGNTPNVLARGTFAPTSGTALFEGIMSNPTINQTGGANGAIRVLAAYPVNTALVGTEYLIAAGTSSATGPTGTLTDKFLVDSNGATIASSTITAPTYATTTNCAAVGTAANPSVASCSAASAGTFSCATNASTGTCTVNTTAVTANSEIFITQRSDTTTGTRLSVTCNTTVNTVTPEITAVTAASSFTINLGTFTTNPECFSYFIIN